MSAEHHGASEEAARNRLLDEFLNRAKPAFPQGKISDHDRGELAFAVALDLSKKAVVIRFAKPVDWIGLGKAEALRLATLLKEKADQL